MSLPTNYWASFSAGVPSFGSESNREDLADLITNLDKDKIAATFLALPKTTTNSLHHEWLIDSLTTQDTAGVTEGDDFSAGALGNRTRYGNVVQSFRKDFAVTMDQIKLSQNGIAAGVPNEYEYQVGKKLMELTQSMDARIVALGSTVASNAGAGGTARLMATLRAWSALAIQESATGLFTVAEFMKIHERMFGAGARPDTLVCSHGVKADITRAILDTGAQSGNRLTYFQPSSQVYDQSVEYMRTDFGRVAILVDIFVPQAAVSNASEIASSAYFVFDKSKIRMAFFRQLRHYPLPPNGDAFRGYVHGSFTLEVLHPSALGMHTQVTT